MEAAATDVLDRSLFVEHGTGGDYTLHTIVDQDVSEIKRLNHAKAERDDNGFSDGRTQRTIATLSSVEYLQAIQLGYQLHDPDPHEITKEIKRYLRERGQALGYQAVRNVLTPGRSANIIVR